VARKWVVALVASRDRAVGFLWGSASKPSGGCTALLRSPWRVLVQKPRSKGPSRCRTDLHPSPHHLREARIIARP
jgi:hypothetical protein